MTGLTIQADDIVFAFEGSSPGVTHYLDLTTGEVTMMGDEFPDDDFSQRLEAEPDNFLEIDPVQSSEAYKIMEDFVEALPDGEERQRLDSALNQQRPFRRFKDTLYDFPQSGKTGSGFTSKPLSLLLKSGSPRMALRPLLSHSTSKVEFSQ